MFFNQKNKSQHGFSIIELMIALAIIGILASIAIPNYQKHVQRGFQTETMSEMMLLMKSMEDFYLVNNLNYTTDLNGLTGRIGAITTSSGTYTITSSQCSDGGGGTLGLSECVELTAIGPRNSDGTFETFILDSEGNKTYNGNDGWPY